MERISKKLFIIIVFCLIFSSIVNAIGIKVAPGAFCLQGADIGKDLDLGVDLVITNDNAEDMTFNVESVKPSQAVRSWLKGYAEIPDPKWFYLSTNKIKVAPFKEGRARMHLNIPQNEAYYNQHWIVYVKVSAAPDQAQMFNVALNANYMIETQPKEKVKCLPHGAMMISPSVLSAKTKTKTIKFRLQNCDSKTQSFKIYTYIPQASQQRQDISVTPGFVWISDEKWVQPKREKIRLQSKKSQDIILQIKLPEDALVDGQGREAVIMVETEKGLAGFVRVQIQR
jgi:hypothetical protein